MFRRCAETGTRGACAPGTKTSLLRTPIEPGLAGACPSSEISKQSWRRRGRSYRCNDDRLDFITAPALHVGIDGNQNHGHDNHEHDHEGTFGRARKSRIWWWRLGQFHSGIIDLEVARANVDGKRAMPPVSASLVRDLESCATSNWRGELRRVQVHSASQSPLRAGGRAP